MNAAQCVLLVEPTNVQDTYVSGLSHIEIIDGSCARFVLFTYQTDRVTGDVHRVVVKKVVMPLLSMPDAIAKSLAVTARDDARRVCSSVPGMAH